MAGYKVNNGSKNVIFFGCAARAFTGTQYLPAIWTGHGDVYADHFYIESVSLSLLNPYEQYNGKGVTAVFGIY